LSLFDKCRQFTRAREVQAAGIYPYFWPISETHATRVTIEGRELVMIGSNNYLGLTEHPQVIEAAQDAIRRFGSGCTGSRFLNGTLDLHVELEEKLAEFAGKEAALTMSTGFQTNLGTISTLVGRDDVIYCDRENHASIIDGCRLSFGTLKKFRHNDMDELERLLQKEPREKGKLIIVDGVFSMRGDLSDVPRIVALAREYGAQVMVDDAHGIGVMGDGGRGTAEHFGFNDDVDLIVGTFSKSFASLGGFVAGTEEVIHYIKHHARALIFSASITPASAAAVLAALDIMEREPERRERLWKIVRRMKGAFDELGFDTDASQSPVIPIRVGTDLDTFKFWRALFDHGVFTNPVISPAVPPGQGLIRTSYMATHTEEDLDRVLDVFANLGREFGLIP
jgi:8-amino-7-oxononanoate synthase